MAKRLNSGEECEFCDTHIKIEYDNISEIKVVNADMTFEDHCSFDLGKSPFRRRCSCLCSRRQNIVRWRCRYR